VSIEQPCFVCGAESSKSLGWVRKDENSPTHWLCPSHLEYVLRSPGTRLDWDVDGEPALVPGTMTPAEWQIAKDFLEAAKQPGREHLIPIFVGEAVVELARLRAALIDFGDHAPGCPTEKRGCWCGWEKLREDVLKKERERDEVLTGTAPSDPSPSL
jgi:hypothetical protein